MPPKPIPAIERALRKVEADENGCWIFTGCTDPHGYGHIGFATGETGLVHRLVYEFYVGPIPDGYHIDHLCKVPSCCNPQHLEAVTPQENYRRSDSPSAINSRKSHCPRGHEYDYTIATRNTRICRTCKNERRRIDFRKDLENAR